MLPIADQLDLELRKLVDPSIYDQWLESPNVDLDMKTPQQLFDTRNHGPLWALIHKMSVLQI
jgi:hypothetical protein